MDALDLGVACRPQVWVGGRALPAPYELVGQPVAEVAPPIAELLWTRRPYGADRTRPVPG